MDYHSRSTIGVDLETIRSEAYSRSNDAYHCYPRHLPPTEKARAEPQPMTCSTTTGAMGSQRHQPPTPLGAFCHQRVSEAKLARLAPTPVVFRGVSS